MRLLAGILGEIAAVVIICCAVGAVSIIGRQRLRTLAAELRPRLRESAPYLGGLAVVLLLNSVIRNAAGELSWLIGWNITAQLEAIEGGFVTLVQSTQTELLTTYFAYLYIYGYVVLLVFPLFAYLALDDRQRFRQLVAAYGLNYLLGLGCYILFIAYGPRNVHLAENLLYGPFPHFEFLTTEVNSPTNVFPSLHTSLSATAAIFALKTHGEYPRWTPIAVWLAGSIILSTMYLGVHWATDVVAGLVLAATAVILAERYVDSEMANWRAFGSRLAHSRYVPSGLGSVVAAVTERDDSEDEDR